MNTNARTRITFFMATLGILICLWHVDASTDEFVDGWTTHIHKAIASGDLPGLEALFDAGGDVDIQDRNGDTPINVAARDLNIKFVKFLLRRGADITICNTAGDTPLHSVVKHVVKSWNETRMQLRLLELFIKQDDGPLSVKNFDNLTPLHLAAELDQYDAARLLLRHGANIEAGDLGNRTPLHYAATTGNKRIVRFLLRNKANVNAENCLGERPIHCAVRGAHIDVVWLLLRYGADVNAITKEIMHNNTPLHELARTIGIKKTHIPKYCHCALMLLRAGADVSIKNNEEKDPIQLAYESYNDGIAVFIDQYLAKYKSDDE